MSTQPYHGSAQALRDEIEDALTMLAISARLGADHAAIGDSAATIHCIRRVSIYLKVAVASVTDLQALRIGS